MTLHSLNHHNCNCNYTTLINYTTPQLQPHYTTTTTTAALHHTTSSSSGWGDRPGDHRNHCNHSQITTPKNTTFGPSVDSLCHLWFTTANLSSLSYRCPIFKTSATALRGTTDWNILMCMCIYIYIHIYNMCVCVWNICIYVCICVYMYICMQMHLYIYIYINMYRYNHEGRFVQKMICPRKCGIIMMMFTSSTAQAGGGSFKNRKPIGEIGCCESGMAERIHWWTERCLRSPLFLSLSLTIYLPTYLPSMYLSIYQSIYLSFPLSSNYYLSIYLSVCLSIYRSIYLSLSLFHLSSV